MEESKENKAEEVKKEITEEVNTEVSSELPAKEEGEVSDSPKEEVQPAEDNIEALEPAAAEVAEEDRAADTEVSSEEIEPAVETAVEEEVEVSKEDAEPVEAKETAEEQKEEPTEEVTAETVEEADSEEPKENIAEAEATDHDSEEEHEELEEEKDYSGFSKAELVAEIEAMTHESSVKKVSRIVKEIQPLFEDILKHEREDALKKFVAEGGAEDDFEYRQTDLDNRYDASMRLLKDRRSNFHKAQEEIKQTNLEKKNDLLERLRQLVDGEETTTSINVLKELQQEWKDIGMVPAAFAKTMWANYHALIDRFYDNRSIYFELKELDRKKNLVLKEELCVKAESLEKVDNLKEAIGQLNEFHEEYKHIGPVPREEQENLWQRFKAASDKVYARRKEYIEEVKKELTKNLDAKKEIITEVLPFSSFSSDRINEWNAKTKEILAIQKKWETIGGLPRDKAKEINKEFWGSFKTFFSKKNAFFKTLEGQREENLKLKETLVQKAEELKESLEWDATAKALKKLQMDWKEIGPVPQKKREEIFARFKAACDHFFENKRANSKGRDSEYQANYNQKAEICDELITMAKEKSADQEKLSKLIDHWNEIGFVPKRSIKEIQNRFFEALEKYLNSSELSDDDKEKWRITAKFSNLKSKPNADSRLNSKEHTLRKQISQLESDISLWKNNLEFFASSKTADKLKHDFDQKIEEAENQLNHLKDELKIIKQM